MQSASSVEDYTVRVAQRWGVGQKEHKNGVVLFVFQESHDVRIVTGYGLEGALPDALCKQIIEDEIVPRFRSGDFDGGLTAGVHALMAAARGEYRGTGRTRTAARAPVLHNSVILGLTLFILFLSVARARARRSILLGRGGRRSIWGGGPWSGGWG